MHRGPENQMDCTLRMCQRRPRAGAAGRMRRGAREFLQRHPPADWALAGSQPQPQALCGLGALLHPSLAASALPAHGTGQTPGRCASWPSLSLGGKSWPVLRLFLLGPVCHLGRLRPLEPLSGSFAPRPFRFDLWPTGCREAALQMLRAT